ncbi:CBS domain-containing protein [Synechococcus sp. PCC 7502]|uniref:hemolysin family protein n=1 Tax=Synechococcus sp. PCC 7502 TaxID=1173263 RepID=UPI00029F986A|nr:hemolysin family protein [Synechococcus sp. PCC 7502]AFY73367.1 CBS domain-containing protein [Synechococcus sp. PCC 7502]
MDDLPRLLMTPIVTSSMQVDSQVDLVGYVGMMLTLVAVNAYFVAAEFAIVSVRRSRIHQLVESGSGNALVVQRLQRHIDRFLSSTQLGITLSSIGLGWLGKDVMAIATQGWLNQLLPTNLSNSLAAPIAFLLVVYLQIVLGELVPKSVTLMNSERMALWLAKPSEAIANIFSPFLWVLNQSTRLLLKIARIEYTSKSWYSAVSAEELQMIITTSSESVGLEAEERELLKNVFEFGEVTAGEIMVPRTSMQWVEFNSTVKDLLAVVNACNHSRYPVAGESLDDIRGIVQIKEIIGKLGNGELKLDQDLTEFIRPVRFVSQEIYLGELLPQMQRSQQSIVIVVDEFGGTAGLVTLEDIVAEIVGSFNEPPASAIPDIKILDDRTSLVQAQVSVEELNDVLDLNLPLIDEYQTLGGFITYHFQKIPHLEETFVYKNLQITIAAMDGPRLDRIKIHRLEPE